MKCYVILLTANTLLFWLNSIMQSAWFWITIVLNTTAYYSAPKSFRSVKALELRPLFWWHFSEALSIIPHVLPIEINFVLKGMSRIVNFDYWQGVWKHLIIHIRLFHNIVLQGCIKKNAFPISFPVLSKQGSDNKSFTFYNVSYAER